MVAVRGRIGQFRVLRQEQALASYLVPTVRFSERPFFQMLAQTECIVLKPVVGDELITVTRRENDVTVVSQQTCIEVSNATRAYKTVLEIKQNQNYVMQPVNHRGLFWTRPYYMLITTHRSTNQPNITTISNKVGHLLQRLLVKLYADKIYSVSQLVANTLYATYRKAEAIVTELSVNLLGDVQIHDTFLHFSISKWSQYQVLRSVMPETDLLTEASLYRFLANYEDVFIKPCNGQQGRGVVKITRAQDGYLFHRGRTKTFVNLAQLAEQLPRGVNFIIQQGIALARINDAVFDIRVLVKKQAGHWFVDKQAGKVAVEGYVVTNAAQAVLHVDTALMQSDVINKNVKQLNAKLQALCLHAARYLDDTERTLIGFDVGLTKNGELFIIEANFMPDLAMFYALRPNVNG